MSKLINLVGRKIGKLTVRSLAANTRNNRHIRWICECECGNIKEISGTHLRGEKIKSCGCLRLASGSKHRDWKGVGEISGDQWDSIKRSSTCKNRESIEFAITLEFAWELFLKQKRKCALTGIELSWGHRKNRTASLDRIDNGKGYTEDNVQWVHKRINMMKGTLAQDYFIELCRAVALNNP